MSVRAYVQCAPRLGQGIHRVVRELQAHAPADVTFTEDRAQADLIVHHVVGVQNFSDGLPIDQLIQRDAATGKSAAVIQYCLATTEQPDPAWWATHVWAHCAAVWSYYDLRAACHAAAQPPGAFYHAPLGVSAGFAAMAQGEDQYRDFLVGTSGYVAESEGVDAWVAYAASLGERVFHLGPTLPVFDQYPGVVQYAQGLTDAELAIMWGRCVYVNGLRAVEGFELPAVEGLVCGARPVLFDRDHHRTWLGHHAIYLPEDAPVRQTLEASGLTRAAAGRVTEAERGWARETFAWPALVQDFWAAIGGR